MKSMASSIQPNFAAISTRHCSRVTVRYHGTSSAAPPASAAPVDANRGSMRGGAYQRRQRRSSKLGFARALDRARRYNQRLTPVHTQKEISMAVDVGAKAPDFTLHNQDREPV